MAGYFEFHGLMKELSKLDGKIFSILSSKEDNNSEYWNENAVTYYKCTIQLRKLADP